MGEGAESFHAAFNNTERAYKNMKNNVDSLRVVLENNHFRILPSNESLQPPLLIKRRWKRHNNTHIHT